MTKEKVPTKAQQSHSGYDYCDLNTGFLQRTAAAMTEGREKYEQPQGLPYWKKNYHKGDPTFFLRRLNHAIEHLLALRDEYFRTLQGAPSSKLMAEDHLGHAAANLNMLAWAEGVGMFSRHSCDPDLPSTDTVPSEGF